MKRIALGLTAMLGAGFLLIQLVPYHHPSSEKGTQIAVPSEVQPILARACFDCHSNETTWPWYSRIAPFSWQIAKDVSEGRAALNFSSWNRLSAEDQIEARTEIAEVIHEREMPPRIYLLAHRDARLDLSDQAALSNWLRTENIPNGELDLSEDED